MHGCTLQNIHAAAAWRRYGAPVNKTVVLFVDDVNMPARERYGAQPPVELLRQLLDHGGFYDRNKLFWKDVQDTLLCAACAPPGGGRQEVTPRCGGALTLLSCMHALVPTMRWCKHCPGIMRAPAAARAQVSAPLHDAVGAAAV